MTTSDDNTLSELGRRVHDAVAEALVTCEQTDLHEQPHSAEHLPEIADLADRLVAALEELRRQPTNLGKHSEHKLPTDLMAARRLYEHLVDEGEGMSVEKVLAFMKDCERLIAVGNDDEYIVVEPNLSRRGLSFVYAAAMMHYILCGTFAAPEVERS